ncbi:MAG TPA: radical SAM protein [Polyangiaceae bacterium]|jgi:MoaA/NifB/PqqE/SkfB family radical SAM enzyme|nr:radical SAM protein [Polyangiaceae bacterium]
MTTLPVHLPWIGPKGQVMDRLELHLTYSCPERCTFCSEEHRMRDYRRFPVTWGRVATVLRAHASRGVKSVHLTGGEPTIHPDFVDVLILAKKLGMRTSVGTIGTMLCQESFAARALPYLDEALFSLHGPSAEVHDRLTRTSGSFDRVTAALKLALKLRPDFGAYVNTVVTRFNVDELPDTVGFVDALGAKLVVVSNTTPEGGGLDRYAELAVPLEKLAEVLPRVPARAERAILRFFGVPMCLLGRHGMLSNDLHWDPRVTVEWASAPGKVVFDGIYSWTPDRKRVHVKECDDCSARSVCMGVFDRYAELFSTDALRAQ